MSDHLTKAEVERYNRDGYLFPFDVLTPAEVADARRKLEAMEAKLGGPLPRSLIAMPNIYAPFVDEIIRSPKILDRVESLLGPDILCWECAFLTKEPHAKSFFSWHQDAKYWGLEPYEVLTAWVALSPATKESGCMSVMTGSHIGELSPHKDTFGKDNMLSRGQEIAAKVDENEAIDVVLQPGEMSLHHVLLVHGSGVNKAKLPRVGFAIRYIPTRLRQNGINRTSATLARGRDTYGHFDHETRPEGDLHPAAVERHRQITEAQLNVLYAGAAQAGKRTDADIAAQKRVAGGM